MISAPGVARDGTRLFRDQHNDAQWCRWYQGRARKMRGYREQVRNIDGPGRTLDVFANDTYSYVHVGTGNAFQRYAIQNGTGSNTGVVSRTPAGYVPSDQNIWQTDQMYDVAGTTTNIFAAATPSAQALTSSAALPVYYGDIVSPDPLLVIPSATTSGGLCVTGPYLFLYGHDGVVQWSVPGNPLDFTGAGSGDARPVASKIVKGMALRGSSGPSVILWSLDSVIIGQWVGGADVFDFTTVTKNSSILSSSGVVEHNGIYYWPTSSGFSMFNGVMRDLPNDMNRHWFLDNLNMPYRQRVFGFKIPRWDEIWWCFPFGNATENTHAVVYNYKENTWYDTMLPDAGRSAGYYETIFSSPIMCSPLVNTDTGGTSAWQHEFGLDEISGALAIPRAIPSWFETNEFNSIEVGQMGAMGVDQALSFNLMEPDFDQRGDLYFSTITRANARAKLTPSDTILVPAVPTAGTQLVKFRRMGRLTAFRIESNEVGGDYTVGCPLIHVQPGDQRRED